MADNATSCERGLQERCVTGANIGKCRTGRVTSIVGDCCLIVSVKIR